MRKWVLPVVFLLMLAMILPAAAYDVPTDFGKKSLEQVMETFMVENGLDENNFSVSYYNTATGESYAFNDKTMMVAASTFKLPLNMYYYELEQAGELEPDAVLDRVGVKLSLAHELSLVQSNNEVSIGMLYSLGDFRTYKALMRKYFTLPDEEINYLYYADNYYCTHMMIDALKYLYENRENFGEMLGYMKQAQPGEYFKAGVTEYEVAHKYGWYDGAVNDVGIIYTEEPFLLAVYTQGLHEQVVADTAALLTAWNTRTPPDNSILLEVEMVPVPEEEGPVQEVFAPEEEMPSVLERDPAAQWWLALPAAAVAVFVTAYLLRTKKRK